MHKEIRLISKRNKVFRIVEDDRICILKKFENHENYIREKEILNVLDKAGVKVPSIIKAEENYLYLEDLGKVNFLDWYEEQEKSNTFDLSMVYELCSWLKNFYSVIYELNKKQFIINDVNFKNFLIVDNKIYGIDFEQVQPGNIEEDAGKLSAFGLTYTPAMTDWKINFRNIFIDILSKELNIEKEKILAEEKIELKAIEKRRHNMTLSR